jgi:hypothetical protein
MDPRVRAGALLFGRYAFPPNRLGYCGPEAGDTLLQYVTAGRTDQDLLALARRFDGAYPYLRLIALANAIAEPFDRRVVEAYWIGNPSLGRVTEGAFYDSLRDRFQPQAAPRAFGHLISLLDQGGRPHHNFHVFNVYRTAGLARDPHADITLAHLDRCRISWGRVLRADGPDLLIERQPLLLRAGRLVLGPPAPVRVRRQLADDAPSGAYVSVHWDWACQVLRPQALRWLVAETRAGLQQANLIL